MLYRWPQGRMIRTLTMVLVMVVVVDLAWQGAYGAFDPFLQSLASYEADLKAAHYPVALLVKTLFFSLLSLAVLVAGIVAIGFHPKSAQFLIEVEQEMTRVSWPSKNDVIRSTVAIAIMTLILALLIAFTDTVIISTVINGILDRS